VVRVDHGSKRAFMVGILAACALAAWTPANKQYQTTFSAEAGVTDLAGKQSSLPAGRPSAADPVHRTDN
jgi:hypothetical protein